MTTVWYYIKVGRERHYQYCQVCNLGCGNVIKHGPQGPLKLGSLKSLKISKPSTEKAKSYVSQRVSL